MTYNFLYYDSIDVKVNDNKLEVKPTFLCPVCDGRPKSKVKQDFEEDFNGPLTFQLDCCDLEITLYVKVTTPLGTPKVTISTEPIM